MDNASIKNLRNEESVRGGGRQAPTNVSAGPGPIGPQGIQSSVPPPPGPTGRRPEYLNTKEAAEVLRRPISTLYFWRKRGVGPPSFRLGKQFVYPRASLDEWVVHHTEEAS